MERNLFQPDRIGRGNRDLNPIRIDNNRIKRCAINQISLVNARHRIAGVVAINQWVSRL